MKLLLQFDAKLSENRVLYYESEKYKQRSKQLSETMLEMSQDLYESQHSRDHKKEKKRMSIFKKKKNTAAVEIEAIVDASYNPKTQRPSISGAELLQAHGLTASMAAYEGMPIVESVPAESLERAIDERNQDLDASTTTNHQSLLRTEPNLEFFQMCLLSFKMNN